MKDCRHHSFEQRFTSVIKIRGLEVCWFPKVQRTQRPNISFKGLGRLVSHLTLEELCGLPRPIGYIACHSCDMPTCCNPTHLRWDTYTENNNDMVRRKRWIGPKGKKWKYTKEQCAARSGSKNGRYVGGKYAKK